MARVTVEDCIDKVSNRFELVLLAAHRARMISGGIEPSLDRDNDKNPVLALREIAVETVTFDDLMESTIESHQRQIEVDEPDDEDLSLLTREGQRGKEENADGTLPMIFDYDIIKNPNKIDLGDEKDFVNYIGDILIELMDKQIKDGTAIIE